MQKFSHREWKFLTLVVLVLPLVIWGTIPTASLGLVSSPEAGIKVFQKHPVGEKKNIKRRVITSFGALTKFPRKEVVNSKGAWAVLRS